MIEVGRICLKLAGRDGGKKCVVVDVLKNNLVLIDGETRRRKCNIKHLMPVEEMIKIKKNASHADVLSEFKKLGYKVWVRKPKKAGERPKRVRKKKEKPVEEKKKKKENAKLKEEKKVVGNKEEKIENAKLVEKAEEKEPAKKE